MEPRRAEVVLAGVALEVVARQARPVQVRMGHRREAQTLKAAQAETVTTEQR